MPSRLQEMIDAGAFEFDSSQEDDSSIVESLSVGIADLKNTIKRNTSMQAKAIASKTFDGSFDMSMLHRYKQYDKADKAVIAEVKKASTVQIGTQVKQLDVSKEMLLALRQMSKSLRKMEPKPERVTNDKSDTYAKQKEKSDRETAVDAWRRKKELQQQQSQNAYNDDNDGIIGDLFDTFGRDRYSRRGRRGKWMRRGKGGLFSRIFGRGNDEIGSAIGGRGRSWLDTIKGKVGVGAVTPAMESSILSSAAKSGGFAKSLKAVPVLGTLLATGLAAKTIYDAQTDDDLSKDEKGRKTSGAAGSAIGGTAGAIIGGTIGSVIPGAGTVVGAGIGGVAGSYIGEWIGERAYDKPVETLLPFLVPGFGAAFQLLSDDTKKAIEKSFSKSTDKFTTEIGVAFTKSGEYMKNLFTNTWEETKKGLTNWFNSVEDFGEQVVEKAKPVVQVVQQGVTKAKDAAKAVTTTAVDAGIEAYRVVQEAFTPEKPAQISIAPRVSSSKGMKGVIENFKLNDPYIQYAAKATGVDLNDLRAKIQMESNFQAGVKASTSSATGLGQFIQSTWIDTIGNNKKFLRNEGYGNVVDLYEQTKSKDGNTRKAAIQQLADMRSDPRLNALMTAKFDQNNADALRARGLDVNATNLYAAHFMGASGGSQLIEAAKNNPDAIAASMFPKPAAANRSIFYEGSRPRTVKEVYEVLNKKTTNAKATVARIEQAAIGTNPMVEQPLVAQAKIQTAVNQPQVKSVKVESPVTKEAPVRSNQANLQQASIQQQVEASASKPTMPNHGGIPSISAIPALIDDTGIVLLNTGALG